MKKIDALIIIIVIFIASFLFINKRTSEYTKGNNVVHIIFKNELILKVDIDEQTEMKILILFDDDEFIEYRFVEMDYSIPDKLIGYDLLYIYNNGIEVIEDDSLNRIIARQGFVNQYNYPLISIPRSLVILIKGQVDEIGIILS